MKHLYIVIEIREGEFEHTHKILHSTNCQNLQFAAEWYVAHYWGFGERDRWFDKRKTTWWWWDGVHCGRLDSWEEVPEEDYEVLSKYL